MPTKVYVGNLPLGCKDQQLHDLFSSYGEITECDIIKGKQFAFVHFVEEAHAKAAIEDLNGSMFEGAKIEVTLSKGQKYNRSQRPPLGGNRPTKIYVGRLPEGFSSNELRKRFEKFGEITEADMVRGKQFGFVHFKSSYDADNAIEEMNKSKIDGKEIEVKLSENQGVSRDNRPPPKSARNPAGDSYEPPPFARGPPMMGMGRPPAPMNGPQFGARSAGIDRRPEPLPRPHDRPTDATGYVIYERYFITKDHPLLKGLPIAEMPKLPERRPARYDDRYEDSALMPPTKMKREEYAPIEYPHASAYKPTYTNPY